MVTVTRSAHVSGIEHGLNRETCHMCVYVTTKAILRTYISKNHNLVSYRVSIFIKDFARFSIICEID